MPRKKTTNKPPNGETDSKANANATDAEPKVISAPTVPDVPVPHVPHSIIALSVLITIIGSILITLDDPPRGWLTIAGIVVAMAGALVYLGSARKIEGRQPIWTHVLFASVVFGVTYGLVYGGIWLVEHPLESPPPLPTPQVATEPPSPSETASPTPQLPNSRILIHQPSGGASGQQTDVRILDLRFNPGGLLTSAIEISDLFVADGRIVIGPEYFTERRKNSPNLTMAQIQAMNDALIGKLIMFSGVLEEAVYFPTHKDIHVEVKHESSTDTAVVTEEKQMQQVQLLQKGSPIALLCRIKASNMNKLEFMDCEVMP